MMNLYIDIQRQKIIVTIKKDLKFESSGETAPISAGEAPTNSSTCVPKSSVPIGITGAVGVSVVAVLNTVVVLEAQTVT
jgi:hypothetical protein